MAHFGLQNHIRLNTGVKRAVWDLDKCIWIIETDTSETLEATHLISGCGVLRTPNTPNFKENECPSNYLCNKKVFLVVGIFWFICICVIN